VFGEYAELLGYLIKPGARRTLYLAMDRPQQPARSFRRMVGEGWRSELDDRLAVRRGPPPYDLAKHPTMLLTLAREAGADTVVLDSLKDAAVGLVDDEVGATYRQARHRRAVRVNEAHVGRGLHDRVAGCTVAAGRAAARAASSWSGP